MFFLVFQFCPTYRFEGSRPFHGDLKKTMADPLDKVDECAARYSQLRQVTAWYSQVQPSTAKYSQVQPGRAKYSLVKPGTAWNSMELFE